jgi:hypothetical protein
VHPENQPTRGAVRMLPQLTLIVSIVALVAWAFLIFGGVTTSGVTHLLLAVGTVLFVRWWALRA